MGLAPWGQTNNVLYIFFKSFLLCLVRHSIIHPQRYVLKRYATETNDRLQKFTLFLLGNDAYKRAANKI